MFLDYGFAIKHVFRAKREFHLVLVCANSAWSNGDRETSSASEADELAEEIDFNACVHVLRTRDLAVTQAKKLFECRGWWKPALQELMESSKQGPYQEREGMMSTANPLSIRRSSVDPPQ